MYAIKYRDKGRIDRKKRGGVRESRHLLKFLSIVKQKKFLKLAGTVQTTSLRRKFHFHSVISLWLLLID